MNIKQTVFNYFPALNHKPFRWFWSGQIFSLIGTWTQNIGQAWIVLQLTDSPFLLGVVSALQFLPMLLFSLHAGVLIDRFSKRRILIFTQTTLMVLALLMAILVSTEILKYWMFIVFASILGLVNTIDVPTRQSFIIDLVNKKDLTNAIALNSAIFNGARLIGPAFAGLILGIWGATWCFILNSLSFVGVVVILNLLPKLNYSEMNYKEKNSLKYSSLENSFEDNSFKDNSLSNSLENNLLENNLLENNLLENNLLENNLLENNSLENNSLENNPLENNSKIKESSKKLTKAVLPEILDGLRYIRCNPPVLLGLIMIGVVSSIGMNFNVLVPVLAKYELQEQALGYGLLMSSMGFGAMLGAITVAVFSKNGPKLYLLFGGATGLAFFSILLGLQSNYYTSALILGLIGWAMICFSASTNSMVQTNSDNLYRGRVMSVYSLVFGGLAPFGSIYAGVISSFWGAKGTFVLSGLLIFVFMIILLFQRTLLTGGCKHVNRSII